MASKGQITGMRGVFLVAAELAGHEFIVSPTSRSAAGVDLLVTDALRCRAFTVEVKTNGKPVNFWLVGERYSNNTSSSHFYVFVNIRDGGPHDFYVVPSAVVAEKTRKRVTASSAWYEFYRADAEQFKEAWDQLKPKEHAALPSRPS